MPRKGHSEEKIVYALRQVEAGKTVSEVCREMGVSPQAFYSWKRRYAGLGLSELRQLRERLPERRELRVQRVHLLRRAHPLRLDMHQRLDGSVELRRLFDERRHGVPRAVRLPSG